MPFMLCGRHYFFSPQNNIMSEEQQMQVAKLIDKEVENKRRVAWGGFGVELYHGEITLQLRAQEITTQLIKPETSEQIAAAEAALAKVKKECAALIENRKEKYTARFISVTKRLMKPEQEIEEAIKANEAAIIKAKQAQKEELKTQENKDKELRQIAEQVRIYVADMHASYLKAQLTLLSKAYENALENNITVEALPEYLAKVRARVTIKNMATPPPKPAFKYNTQESVDAVISEHFNPWPAQKYVDGFLLDLTSKFSDWELALKNKQQAKKLNDDEVALTTEAIDDNKEQETVAAKLDSIAMPLTETPGVKELKERYNIIEPETLEQAFAIVNAFIVNKKLCVPELNKIKPVNLGVKQMMGALEDIKNKDENFEVTGIVFTKIEKL